MMANGTDEFIDSILLRLADGPDLTEEEFLKAMVNVNKKILDVETKIEVQESELKNELESLKVSHSSNCQSDPLALNCFLNNVLQATERNVDLEDYILKDLINFCHRNCIILPPFTNEDYDAHQSRTSLNSCVDEVEELTIHLWTKIKRVLKNGIVNLLKVIPAPQQQLSVSEGGCLKVYYHRRLGLLELLCCFYPFEEVANIYCHVQSAKLESSSEGMKKQSVGFASDNDSSRTRAFKTLEKVVEIETFMLNEDLQLLHCLSDRKNKCSLFQMLIDIYMNNILKYLQKFISCHVKSLAFNNPIDNDSFIVEKFTANDLRNFAKLFYMLANWSTTVEKIVTELSDAESNTEGNDLTARSSKVKVSSLIQDESIGIGSFHIPDWREEIKLLVPVLKQVAASYIQCIRDSVIGTAQSSKINPDSPESNVFISSQLLAYDENYPISVPENCGTFITLLSEMIPLTNPNNIGVLDQIREETLKSLVQVIVSFTSYYHEALTSFADLQSNLDQIYKNLAEISLIYTQLEMWEKLSGCHKSRRNDFVMVKKDLVGLREEYIKFIIKYHLDMMKKSIVYDSHSNDWEDDKPFFEGERCSFPIQMWKFYIHGVIHDIFGIFPYKTSKHILKEICTEMLTFFTFRYAYIKPSYARVKQVKADILVLLSTFKWVMLFLAEDALEYMDTQNTSFSYWHTLCTALLDVAVILGAPLNVIASHLDGLNLSENDMNSYTQTKTWYNDMCFSPLIRHDADMIQFEILTKQPVVDWKLLAKLIASNNSTIAILLSKNLSYLMQPKFFEEESQNWKLNEMFTSTLPHTVTEPMQREKYLQHVYNILLSTSSLSYVQFMASLIETDNSKSFKVSGDEQLTIWLGLIAKHLRPTFIRILHPAIDLLLHEDKLKAEPSFTFTKLQNLPCGCPTIMETDAKSFKTVPALLHKCLMTTLDILTENITSIPEVIWELLAFVKNQESFTASWLKQSHLGTKILASLLYQVLSKKETYGDLICDVVVSESTHENIKAFAELLWHVVYHLTHDVTDNPKITMYIFKDLQNTANRIMEKLSALDKYCNRDKCKYRDDEDQDEVDSLSQLIGSATGMESLHYLYAILKINEEVVRQLLVDNSDDSLHKMLGKYPTGNGNPSKKRRFNPLMEFKLIQNLDHAIFLEAQLNWEQLVASITREKCKSLITNRFEFQPANEGILREEELRDVAKIKELLNMQ